jgi:hypothetical protein
MPITEPLRQIEYYYPKATFTLHLADNTVRIYHNVPSTIAAPYFEPEKKVDRITYFNTHIDGTYEYTEYPNPKAYNRDNPRYE